MLPRLWICADNLDLRDDQPPARRMIENVMQFCPIQMNSVGVVCHIVQKRGPTSQTSNTVVDLNGQQVVNVGPDKRRCIQVCFPLP